MDRLGIGVTNTPTNFSDYRKLLKEKFPDRFVEKGSTGFYDKKLKMEVTPFNMHDYDILLKNEGYGTKINTFTFESPRIPKGDARHYDDSTLGHSRTYTTPQEPDVLHVMESQSDWGQSGIEKRKIDAAEFYRRERLIQNDIEGL